MAKARSKKLGKVGKKSNKGTGKKIPRPRARKLPKISVVVPTEDKYRILAKGIIRGEKHYDCEYEFRQYDPIHRTISIENKLWYLPFPYILFASIRYGQIVVDRDYKRCGDTKWHLHASYYVGFMAEQATLKNYKDLKVYYPPLTHIDSYNYQVCLGDFPVQTMEQCVEGFFRTQFAGYWYSDSAELCLKRTYANLERWQDLSIKEAVQRIRKSTRDRTIDSFLRELKAGCR